MKTIKIYHMEILKLKSSVTEFTYSVSGFNSVLELAEKSVYLKANL